MNEIEIFDPELEEEITTKDQLENFFNLEFRHCGAAFLRFILMAFVCFWSFGSPDPTGILSTISGFAIPCFFILSGFFILPDDKGIRTDKEKRKIKRSLICLILVFVLYVLINLFVFGAPTQESLMSKRIWFNFLVLNLWPFTIGTNIWFIQAMLYAYIVILIAEKLNLMRFYKAVMIITFIFMLLSGEFAGLIHFSVLGYDFIPGNWFTRALPYILLGKFLREKEEALLKTAVWKYIAVWIIGAGLVIAEIYALMRTGYLVYEGHMIGYGIMAFAACGLAISKPLGGESPVTAFITVFDPALAGIIYIFMDPCFYALFLILGNDHLGLVSHVGGLAAYAVSVLIAFVLKDTKLAKVLFT